MRQFRSIMLAGGAGFVGSALARQLLRQDGLERLVVLDKLVTSRNRGRLIGPDHDPRFRFVEGDIANREVVDRLLGEHEVTGVFNLASAPRQRAGDESAGDFVHTNVAGAAILLEACRAARVPLLHCSTDEVYGSVDPPHRFTNLSRLRPSSLFAASKASGDLFCSAAVKSHGQDVVVTRSSDNFGPRQDPAAFIPALVAAALDDRPLRISGDGMTIRDWIHVDDHCRGLIAAFARGASGGLYLFGGQCERTEIGIARDILEILGKPETLIRYERERAAQDRRYAVDNTRATSTFGWRPQQKFRMTFPSIVRAIAADFHASAREETRSAGRTGGGGLEG